MQACYGPQKEDLLRQRHIITTNAWNGLTLILDGPKSVSWKKKNTILKVLWTEHRLNE